jgi:hypothetical protein
MMRMITVFEHIPDVFVEHYDAQFQSWGRDYRARGRKCAIVFDLMPGETPKFDEEDRLVWSGAWLTADLELHRGQRVMMIRPATEFDRDLIERPGGPIQTRKPRRAVAGRRAAGVRWRSRKFRPPARA